MRAQDEFRLACVVAEFLARALPVNVLWSHLPFGENRNVVTGARLKRMGTKRGWPDYLVIANGKMISLELKAPKGKVSDEQREFSVTFSGLGGFYHVCRSLDDVEAALIAAGVKLLAGIA
jgi:hypothetical protein